MASGLRIAAVVLSAAVFAGAGAIAEERRSAQLEAQYTRESSPKKRAKLARQVVEERMKELNSAYETGASDAYQQKIKDYLDAVALLEKAVAEARNTGVSKDAEKHLRRQLRDLENLKMNVSVRERNGVEEILTRVGDLQQEILYSIMNPRRESAKK